MGNSQGSAWTNWPPIHRDVVVHKGHRGGGFGTLITTHNQLQVQLTSQGAVFASVAAMLGDGNASDVIRRRLGETLDADCFATNVTPGLLPFVIYCVEFAVASCLPDRVVFAYLNHVNLPEIARKSVKMMDDGYELPGTTVISETLREMSIAAKRDLRELAAEDGATMQKYGLSPESPAESLTLYGRYSDLVA